MPAVCTQAQGGQELCSSLLACLREQLGELRNCLLLGGAAAVLLLI